MRTKGAKNKRTTFVSFDRLNTKSKNTELILTDFIEKSLTNGSFNKQVDYNLLYQAVDHLKELSKITNS